MWVEGRFLFVINRVVSTVTSLFNWVTVFHFNSNWLEILREIEIRHYGGPLLKPILFLGVTVVGIVYELVCVSDA